MSKYREYHVMWEIEVTARNPKEAARKAREAQTCPDTSAVVFDVCSGKRVTRVDLLEE